jgi:diadenosine tetraphosphate (Ap4A) HIT family hydrolase
MTTEECPICTIVQTQPANLLTTKHWIVSLSRDQGYLGRAYVTLREHKGSLHELSADEWKDYTDIVRGLEKATAEGLGATLCNWSCLMNNAYQQKPYNPHIHWHMRPRYDHAVTINRVIFEDPAFGYHYDREQRLTVDEATYSAILERIREKL